MTVFFNSIRDKDCTPDAYTTNYNKPIDDNMKKIAIKYALDKDILLITPLNTDSPSKELWVMGIRIFLRNIWRKCSTSIFSRNIQCNYRRPTIGIMALSFKCANIL